MSSLLFFKNENRETSCMGKRIQVLTSHSELDKNCSPTLKDLREKHPNRVKRFSELFEQLQEQPWNLKIGCNWWLNGMSPKDFTQPMPKKIEIPPYVAAFDVKMQELRKIEAGHIAQLQHAIGVLDDIVCNGAGYVPMKLRDYNMSLTGDLKTIYGLHKIVISPEISRNDANSEMCIEFIKLIIRLIDDGHFYCYVIHKMLDKSLKKLYKEIAHDSHESSNHNHNLEPFAILDVYNDWITKFCDELMKHPIKNADNVAICMEAEKKLMELIDLVADAEDICRIAQVFEVPIEMHFKVLHIIKKQNRLKSQPMLLMIPRKTFRFGYRYPIDVLRLGHFIKSFVFSMTSQELGYMNDAKFFVFERCILYTTVVHRCLFNYENHFWMKDVMFDVTANDKMYAELNNCNHKVHIDNPQMIRMLIEQKMKHKDDEINAEIDMNESDLIKLVDSFEDAKNWRRLSIVKSSTKA